jgi:putative DNA primase/helicase
MPRISQPNVKAIVKDLATSRFSYVLEFTDVYGHPVQVEIPREMFGDKGKLHELLLAHGASLRPGLRLDDPDPNDADVERWTYAERVGWFEKGRAFVTWERVIGDPGIRGKLLPPKQKSANLGRMHTAGTLRQWSEGVAIPAALSTRMVFGICAALAAPLLGPAKVSPFAINVFGPAKSGKSTMLLVAGSVSGFGTESDLPTFLTTDAAFLELALAFNHMLLPINEMGLLRGNSSLRHTRLTELSYALAEEFGTTYSAGAPSALHSGARRRRCIVLTTGEHAISAIAEQGSAIRDLGAAVRFVDLPSNSPGASHIFDLMPRDVAAHEDQFEWAQRKCLELRRVCRENHGVALEHFVCCVMQHRDTIAEETRRLAQVIADRIQPESAGMLELHLARHFGHVGAAGLIGIRFGTLPWVEKVVMKAIKKCYLDSISSIETEDKLVRGALEIIRENVPRSHGSRPEAARIVVPPGDFKGWFPDIRQPNLVLRYLSRKNALVKKANAPSWGNSIVWAETQPPSSDGGRHRAIEFNWSKDLLDPS